MPSFDPVKTFGYAVSRTGILMRADLERRFSEKGLSVTAAEWVILSLLGKNNVLSQNQLADLTYKDKTTIARFIAKLEKKNLIVRKRSLIDKRHWQVSLSVDGRKSLERLIPIAKRLLDECQRVLGNRRINDMINSLSKVNRYLVERSERVT